MQNNIEHISKMYALDKWSPSAYNFERGQETIKDT
jgi:hypothetical protein